MKLAANAAKPIGPNPIFKVHLPVPLIFRCEKVCFRECNTCFAYCFKGVWQPPKDDCNEVVIFLNPFENCYIVKFDHFPKCSDKHIKKC